MRQRTAYLTQYPYTCKVCKKIETGTRKRETCFSCKTKAKLEYGKAYSKVYNLLYKEEIKIKRAARYKETKALLNKLTMNDTIVKKAMDTVNATLLNSQFTEKERMYIQNYLNLFIQTYKFEFNEYAKTLNEGQIPEL